MSSVAPDIAFSDLACSERELALFDAYCSAHPSLDERFLGRVVRLDRGLPLVCFEKGTARAEHAASVIKSADSLACVGDWVVLACPEGHDRGLIEDILPRTETLVRTDPSERTGRQVLAANIDIVFLLHALSDERVNIRRLEREMVVAYNSGALPVVVLTKADLATHLSEDLEAVRRAVPGIEVIVESVYDGRGVEEISHLIAPTKTAVLLGRSGVGKSALTNALVGGDYQATGSVRVSDNKGRHTTVSRDLFVVRGGGVVIDTPGIRAIALWDVDAGFDSAFPEIAARAAECRFSDCTHTDEPGCAVLEAVRLGQIERRRLESYRALRREVADNAARRAERARLDARRRGGTKASGNRNRNTKRRARREREELRQELDDYRLDDELHDGLS
ncbi:MAG: ribosome small subunit-dependent GTPase A [Coriobacteriales bacterium]